jgi:hypothetical protein
VILLCLHHFDGSVIAAHDLGNLMEDGPMLDEAVSVILAVDDAVDLGANFLCSTPVVPSAMIP